MKQWQVLVLSMVAISACAQPQKAEQQQTSYAGQEQRPLKALSDQDLAMYRGGHGMGLAKAAELNHYPGPKHVLELASGLNLSSKQRDATQDIYERMHTRAVRLGEEMITLEKNLDSLFLTQAIDSTNLAATVMAISRLQGELRLTHLIAHVEMKKLLSAEQALQYDRLRGYGQGGKDDHQRMSH